MYNIGIISASATYPKPAIIDHWAILSPTRGRMRGYGNSHGLCLISNILYKAGIKNTFHFKSGK